MRVLSRRDRMYVHHQPGRGSLNSTPRFREHLEAGESLRGIAIFLVFVFHFLGSLRGYGPNPHANIATAIFFGGSIGVELFFVLSGFLLTMPFFRGSPLDLRQFFTNRVLRIVPMYYLAILCAALWTGRWDEAWRAALFLNIDFGTLGAFSLVWWSLVVEMQFYLVLPIGVALARSAYGRWVLVLAMIGLVWCYAHIASPQAPPQWAAYRNSLLGRWPQFAAGIAAAWVHVRFQALMRRLGERANRWLGSILALAALAGIDLIMLHSQRDLGAAQYAQWYAHYMYVSVLWAVFVIAVVDLRPVFTKIFVNPILHRIGVWSYSIYLLHGVCIVYFFLRLGIHASDAQLGHALRNILLFFGLGGLSLALSAMTYHLVERPFLRLKHSRFLMIGGVREDAM